MSVDKHNRIKSSGIVDQVYGDDTEAFLDELINDDFSEWNSIETNEDAGQTAKHQTNNNFTKALLTKEKPDTESARKTVKGEEPIKETPAHDKAKIPTQELQRKWTRFPKRAAVPTDVTHSQSPGDKGGSAKHIIISQDNAACAIENDVMGACDLLKRTQLQQHVWEDGQDSKFEVRHKKMESYLKNLRHEGRMRRDDKKTTTSRRSSISSMESTTTTSSYCSQDQSPDMRNSSACTVEEVIDCKMKDVEEKFNNSICDAWVDDIELALLLLKRKSKRTDQNYDEVKDLLNNILKQK